MTHLPFISNCEGYGSIIPLGMLIRDNRCNKEQNATSVSFINPFSKPQGDYCDYNLKCRYDETFIENGTILKLWY